MSAGKADIFVSPAEINEFDLAIATACMLKSEDRLGKDVLSIPDNRPMMPRYFYRKDLCLVLSFDVSWYPFLDNTMGYNQGSQRWYVPKASALIARCAQEMQKQRFGSRPGGRLFLHLGGALRSGNVTLLRWTLNDGSKYLLLRRIDEPTRATFSLP
jgi:hypothetical protein